jgi:hypothetical protein
MPGEISTSAFDYLIQGINAYGETDQIGFRIGHAIIEKLARNDRLQDHLEIMKFICKEFWMALFQKQVDNLKTNHRGIYVVTDNSFRWVSRMNTVDLKYLNLPCGIIRGALFNLGVDSTVTCDVVNQTCTFQIKMKI